ncbi:hypothetical protein MHBO_001902 [Bonamia ostreae]
MDCLVCPNYSAPNEEKTECQCVKGYVMNKDKTQCVKINQYGLAWWVYLIIVICTLMFLSGLVFIYIKVNKSQLDDLDEDFDIFSGFEDIKDPLDSDNKELNLEGNSDAEINSMNENDIFNNDNFSKELEDDEKLDKDILRNIFGRETEIVSMLRDKNKRISNENLPIMKNGDIAEKKIKQNKTRTDIVNEDTKTNTSKQQMFIDEEMDEEMFEIVDIENFEAEDIEE